MVTFRLTVDQFQRLLTVILAAETPDHLSDLVLLACTRPHHGIISIPVPPSDGAAIAAAVNIASAGDAGVRDIAGILSKQLAEPS